MPQETTVLRTNPHGGRHHLTHLVVALATEARPLIDHYRMVGCNDVRGFRVYGTETQRLVVTGIGKVNAAAGTAYLAGISSDANPVWLNVGIAGHRNLAAGTGTHATRISDGATGRNWYPSQVASMPGVGVQVITHDQPVTEYPLDCVCDMEASAFFSTAVRFSTSELVQCYKVISDNPSNSIQQLTPKLVASFIGDRLKDIDHAVESLRDLACDLPVHDDLQNDFARFADYWHFTVAQQTQLRNVLRRLRARGAGHMVTPDNWQHCTTSRQLLVEIESYLTAMPVSL